MRACIWNGMTVWKEHKYRTISCGCDARHVPSTNYERDKPMWPLHHSFYTHALVSIIFTTCAMLYYARLINVSLSLSVCVGRSVYVYVWSKAVESPDIVLQTTVDLVFFFFRLDFIVFFLWSHLCRFFVYTQMCQWIAWVIWRGRAHKPFSLQRTVMRTVVKSIQTENGWCACLVLFLSVCLCFNFRILLLIIGFGACCENNSFPLWISN